MIQPTSAKAVLAAPPPEEQARPGVQVTRTQLLQGYNELLESFDSALANEEYGKAVRIYKLADQVEREVLHPSGLSAFASRNAQLAREFGDAATAEIYEGLSIGGFRRAAAARSVNIDQFISTKTAQGIRANFPDVSENDAAKMELVNFDKYEGDDAPIVYEKMQILADTSIGASTRQRMFRVYEDSANLLESRYSTMGTKVERSRFAVTFAHHAMKTNVDPSQFAPAMDALIGFGRKALTLPGAPASGPGVDDGGAPPRLPSDEKVFNFAAATLAAIHTKRQGYESAVTRMLSEGLVTPEDVPEAQTAEGLASGLAALAPLVSHIERVAQSTTPGMDAASISARQTFAKTMLRAFAMEKNLDLFKPDHTLDAGATALLRNVTEYAVNPDDTSALLGMVASSSGVTPIGLISSALDDAVDQKKIEPGEALEIKQAIATKQEVEGNPGLRDLHDLMHSDAGTSVFATLARQVRDDPYVAERTELANRLDAANDEAKKSDAVKAPTPHATVNDALAASLGIARDSRTLSWEERDRLRQAQIAYAQIWKTKALGLEFNNINRTLENLGRDIGFVGSRVGAWFTDDTVAEAQWRKFLKRDLKIGDAVMSYSDLFPTWDLRNRFGADEDHRQDMIKEAVDLGLKEGWLKWDAKRNKLANTPNITAKQIRAAQKKSGDSSPTKVVLKSNDILPGEEVTFDLREPGDFVAATRFIMLKPSQGQDAEDASNKWRAARDTYAREGELVAGYESAYSTVKTKAAPLIRRFLTEGSGQKKSSGQVSNAGLNPLVVQRLLNLGLGESSQKAMLQMEQAAQSRRDQERLRSAEALQLAREREQRAFNAQQKERDRIAKLSSGQDPVASMNVYKQLTEEPPEDDEAPTAVPEDSEAPVPVETDDDWLDSLLERLGS